MKTKEMEPKETEPLKQMTLRMNADVHKWLKIRAAETGEPMGAVIEGLVRQWLAERDEGVVKEIAKVRNERRRAR